MQEEGSMNFTIAPILDKREGDHANKMSCSAALIQSYPIWSKA